MGCCRECGAGEAVPSPSVVRDADCGGKSGPLAGVAVAQSVASCPACVIHPDGPGRFR
ncbi:hypothetical protein FRAAL4855 [Frankia alni ACN14a]|uniref:Uncharacterized protein n=1 Tax=Frankia alni (strain DSM 45986 / CECT 9034 / ACN14a) TaxID=326424 RepID=Q0RG93_FRAAA|nr:hypothetical protein FRAAL4855 [Frankia alni ACN14a]